MCFMVSDIFAKIASLILDSGQRSCHKWSLRYDFIYVSNISLSSKYSQNSFLDFWPWTKVKDDEPSLTAGKLLLSPLYFNLSVNLPVCPSICPYINFYLVTAFTYCLTFTGSLLGLRPSLTFSGRTFPRSDLST